MPRKAEGQADPPPEVKDKPPVGTGQVPPSGEAPPPPEPRPGDEKTFEQRYKGLSTAFTKQSQELEQLKADKAGTAQILQYVQGMTDRMDTMETDNKVLQVGNLAGENPEEAMKVANSFITAKAGALGVDFSTDPRFAEVRAVSDPSLRLTGFRMVSRVVQMEQLAKGSQPGGGQPPPGGGEPPPGETQEERDERIRKETLAAHNIHTDQEPGGAAGGTEHLSPLGKILVGLQERKDQPK